MTPTPGLGATMCVGSDRYAGTIIAVSKSGKTLQWQEDTATMVGGSIMSENQEYIYAPNPHARITTFRQTKRGWTSHGIRLSVGVRNSYRDPCF
jgi:hypothetical protein